MYDYDYYDYHDATMRSEKRLLDLRGRLITFDWLVGPYDDDPERGPQADPDEMSKANSDELNTYI